MSFSQQSCQGIIIALITDQENETHLIQFENQAAGAESFMEPRICTVGAGVEVVPFKKNTKSYMQN